MFNYSHPASPPTRAFQVMALLSAIKYVAALETGMTEDQAADLMKKICHNNQTLIEQTCIILLACAKGRHDAH
jgi:hypothetical protein